MKKIANYVAKVLLFLIGLTPLLKFTMCISVGKFSNSSKFLENISK